jgi:MFS family permease
MCFGIWNFSIRQRHGFRRVQRLIYTVGEMLMMPQAMVHAAASSDEASRGRYVGVYTTGVSLAFVLGPLLFSLIYGYDHDWGWYLTLAIGFVLLIGYFLLGRTADSESEPRGKQRVVVDLPLHTVEIEN